MSERIRVVERIHKANDRIAAANEALLSRSDVLAVNVLASPGAGKTSALVRTIEALSASARVGVVEGDTAPVTIDSERVAAGGVPAVQVNTGGSCHLDAEMVANALDELPLADLDYVFVENVGNLVCTAGFQIGTHVNVLVASVPEGDDKPWKYPKMFRGVDVILLNKIDLLPYVDFDREKFAEGARMLQPGLAILPMSCRTGEGIDAWIGWLEERRGARQE